LSKDDYNKLNTLIAGAEFSTLHSKKILGFAVPLMSKPRDMVSQLHFMDNDQNGKSIQYPNGMIAEDKEFFLFALSFVMSLKFPNKEELHDKELSCSVESLNALLVFNEKEKNEK
jgi:hypothetical protein